MVESDSIGTQVADRWVRRLLVEGPLLEIQASEGWATGVLFLPDGGLLTTGVDAFVKRWNAQGALVAVLTGHEKSVDALALVPESELLVTGSVDATARLWDLKTNSEVGVFTGHKKTVASVATTPDGRLAVTGSYDATIRLWDIAARSEVNVLKGHPKNVVSVRVSPDGAMLASGGVGSELRLWSLPEGKPSVMRSDAHSLAVVVSGFTSDGRSLITAGADNTLARWAVRSLEMEWSVPLGAGGTHFSAISPDGQLLAVTVDKAVIVFDVATGEKVEEIGFGVKGVYGVAFSPDSTILATATADSFVRRWRLR